MRLHEPFIITARLMAGLKIGDAYLSIGVGQRNREGRTVYVAYLDLPDGTEHEISDLQSGCQGGDVQDGMASLLSFLGAAAESYGYRLRTGRTGEHEDLFSPGDVVWAYEHSDEISMLAYELEERPDLVDEA